MRHRPLGNTGLFVSPVGLGTVKLGRNRGVKYPGGEGAPLPDDAQVVELLHACADSGVNLLDTAPAYGLAEERLGDLLTKHAWLGGRDRWVLCSKAGESFDPASGRSSFDFAPESIIASVERSLLRLRTDRLDIVLLHSDGDDAWIILQSGAVDALRELKQRGLVRAVGVSTKTPDGGLLATRSTGGACDVVMVTHNPRDRDDAVVIEAARHRGVGVLVKKALGSGHIDETAQRLPVAFRPAGFDPVEAVLRFSLMRAGVSSVIVGTANPKHLVQAVRAADETVR